MSASSPSSVGPSAEATATRTASSSAVERAEAVEVGDVVAGVERAPKACFREEQVHGRSLRRVDRRHDLQHEPAPFRPETLCERGGGDRLEALAGSFSVLGAAVVERRRQRL